MRSALLLTAILASSALSAQSNTQTQWDDRFSPAGIRHERNFPEEIRTLVSSGGSLYIGGLFEDVNGSPANGMAVWNGRTVRPLDGLGLRDAGGWNASIAANAIAATGDHLIVGGYFVRAGEVESPNLARYHLPSGSWSAFANGTEGEVTALAVVGDTLWVGMGTSPYLSRVHMPSQTWHPFGHPVADGPVRAILPTGSGVYVAGQLPSHLNIRRYRDGRWSAIGGVMITNAGSYTGQVRALALMGDHLIVGGDFNQMQQKDGQPAATRGIARFHIAEERWENLPGGHVDGYVMALHTHGDELIAGGEFREAGGSVAYRIARWSASDLWREMDGGINRQNPQFDQGFQVMSLESHDGEMMVGGAFAQVRAVPEQTQAWNLVRWTSSGWKMLGEGVSGNQVRSIAILPGEPHSVVVVGDNLNDAGATRIRGIGIWNGTEWGTIRDVQGGAGLPSPAGFPGTPGNGYGLVVTGSTIDMVGDFGVAGFDTATDTRITYPAIPELQHVRSAARMADGSLYVGGARFVEGFPTPFIWKWTGAAWADLGAVVGSDIVSMAVHGGRLIVAGTFSSIRGSAVSRLAAYDPATDTWSAFGDPNEVVHTLHATADALYAGGQFTRIGGINANNIARHNPETGAWQALGDGISETWGQGGRVLAITTLGHLVYAGGIFSKAGTVPADHIARWDGQEWVELGGGVANGVSALAAHPSGRIYVGGYFNRVGDGIPAALFTVWDQTDSPVSVEDRSMPESASVIDLLPSYPNPFNPSTRIRFMLTVASQTRVSVYDLLGREVAVLVDAPMPAGSHSVAFQAGGLASGAYRVVVQADGEQRSHTITLVK